MGQVEVTTEEETGYQTTNLSASSPSDPPDSDVVLTGNLATKWSDGERAVQFLVACNSKYPIGGYITLVSDENPPTIKLGPVKVTQQNFITSTTVELAGDYTGTLLLKLSFEPSAMPKSGASVSVSPSVPKDETAERTPPQMVRIGEQTLTF
ncbi:hypothetical protein [Flexibacterium corallicola]|uniref:hypothetical protein n=1 Tax=Flexibacterium corallicola TaxID=3037259 RepID=UPI00286F33CB|nr:hypothetical protein [Pseudovibrio sp. M1P-2-3]